MIAEFAPSPGPDYVPTVVSQVTLHSEQALAALWALHHYRTCVLAADNGWTAERRADVLASVERAIATIEGAK